MKRNPIVISMVIVLLLAMTVPQATALGPPIDEIDFSIIRVEDFYGELQHYAFQASLVLDNPDALPFNIRVENPNEDIIFDTDYPANSPNSVLVYLSFGTDPPPIGDYYLYVVMLDGRVDSAVFPVTQRSIASASPVITAPTEGALLYDGTPLLSWEPFETPDRGPDDVTSYSLHLMDMSNPEEPVRIWGAVYPEDITSVELPWYFELGPGSYSFRLFAREGNAVEWRVGRRSANFTILSPVVVDVDIKPGSHPNSINCDNENEVITVAILTTDTFDATTVDHTAINFEGASEIHVDNGNPIRHEEDVDGDGDLDLLFHFRMGDTDLICDSTEGTLTGETFDGQAIMGTDSVRMIELAAGDDQTVFEHETVSLAPAYFSDPQGTGSHSATVDWGDGSPVEGGIVSESDGLGTVDGSHVYDDNGVYTVTVTVCDDGGACAEDSFSVTVQNVAPTATFSTPVAVNEGDDITLSLTDPYDPSSADTTAGFEYAFDCDDGFGYGLYGSSNSAVCSTDDNGARFVKGKIRDKDGGETEYTASVQVTNVPPAAGPIIAPVDPVAINTGIQASAVFTDPGALDTHTASWDWGDGSTSPGTVSETEGTVTGSHAYAAAGVYKIGLTVTDKDGDSDSAVYEYIVIYNPESGFVTGSGWIDSPEGAYVPDPTLTGKANFGFVSKYKKGAAVPTGQTEFQFKVADLNFHSDSYDWLVVAGAKAKYKGTGTINGTGNYGFMLTAIDEKLTPSTDVDLFRIKIWNKDTSDAVVYDNQMGEADDADPTTGTGGGSIVIHKK